MSIPLIHMPTCHCCCVWDCNNQNPAWQKRGKGGHPSFLGGDDEGKGKAAHQEVMFDGRDSVNQGKAVAMGGPGMDHEEGRLDGGHDSIDKHPVELQHRPLLPPQVLLHQASYTQCYKVLQCHRMLQGVTGCHSITGCYNVTVLQCYRVSQCHRVLQGVPGCYSVTGCYSVAVCYSVTTLQSTCTHCWP